MKKVVVVKYHEIALKGKNRNFFEKQLILNIKKALNSFSEIHSIKKEYGKILIFLSDKFSNFKDLKERLSKIFGIANFAFGYITDAKFDEFKHSVLREVKKLSFNSFRVTAQRNDKSFPMNSQKIAQDIGAFLFLAFQKKIPVNLKNPDLEIFCEINKDYYLFYFEKNAGLYGLPSGVSGRVLSLISGGFDSPVASWKMMRRGALVDFVHFHSYPYTKKESYENVKKIIEVLNQYQYTSKAFFVPFVDIQKEISLKVDSKLKVIFYRRFMLKIAEKLAEKSNIKALVTGDSLAQVASQTLDNIYAISQAVQIPILRPLIGDNKEETIELSKKIGTYELSLMPYDDCCSLFMPSHPETKAKLDFVLKEEKKLDVEAMLNNILKDIELIEFNL